MPEFYMAANLSVPYWRLPLLDKKGGGIKSRPIRAGCSVDLRHPRSNRALVNHEMQCPLAE